MLEVHLLDGAIHGVDAAAWHVDDNQALHLISEDNKPVASFAAGKWVGVERAAE